MGVGTDRANTTSAPPDARSPLFLSMDLTVPSRETSLDGLASFAAEHTPPLTRDPLLTLGVTPSARVYANTLSAGRHDKGYPRFTLHITTTLSDQSYRWRMEAQGGVDGHDARGNSWEIMRWVRLRPWTRAKRKS